jgi:hypothetical protein
MSKFQIGKIYTERDGMYRTKWRVIDRRETASSTGRTTITLRLESAQGEKISSRVSIDNGVEVAKGAHLGFLAAKAGR